MRKKDNLPRNVFKIEDLETAKIPLYKNVKVVNGQIIGEIKGYIDTPKYLMPGNNLKH